MAMQGHEGDERGGPQFRGTGSGLRRVVSDAPEEAHKPDDQTVVTNLEDLARRARGQEVLHPHLIVIAGNNVGKYYRLDRHVTYLGRGETCEVQIQDSGVSRKHARVLVEPDGGVWLEDLSSTNGTFLENHRIDRHQLHDGDKIQLGRTTIIKFSLTDTTELRFAEQMYVSATHDALTRINNRKFFEEQFRAEFAFANRHRIPLSVLMIDLDHFKRVNDTYGHPTGDLVLKIIARTLGRIIRTEDILARYGGEEFVILTRGIDLRNTQILAERIRATVEALLVPNPGGAFRVTVSIGIATLAEGSLPTRAALLAASDSALYRAKRNGRNRVEQWSPGDPLEALPSSSTEEHSEDPS
jgi:diguanylate cyclase (GGDEF)-like protein